jgi:hypothetical protein
LAGLAGSTGAAGLAGSAGSARLCDLEARLVQLQLAVQHLGRACVFSSEVDSRRCCGAVSPKLMNRRTRQKADSYWSAN